MTDPYPTTGERVWHTIIGPTARELEWFAWRAVGLAFFVKLLFLAPAAR